MKRRDSDTFDAVAVQATAALVAEQQHAAIRTVLLRVVDGRMSKPYAREFLEMCGLVEPTNTPTPAPEPSEPVENPSASLLEAVTEPCVDRCGNDLHDMTDENTGRDRRGYRFCWECKRTRRRRKEAAERARNRARRAA